MLQMLSMFCWLLAPLAPVLAGETAWLPTSHAHITLKLAHVGEENCGAGCTHYQLTVRYLSSEQVRSEERTEWSTIRDTGCIDLVTPDSQSFACKQANSAAGSSRSGQLYVLLRFRLQRSQAAALVTPSALLRLQGVTFSVSGSARAALAQFLQPVTT